MHKKSTQYERVGKYAVRVITCFPLCFPTVSPVLSHLKELGPSAVDVELRSLSPEGGGSVDLMAQFLTFIDHVLSTNSDFEITQAYLGLFVKVRSHPVLRLCFQFHSEIIVLLIVRIQ